MAEKGGFYGVRELIPTAIYDVFGCQRIVFAE
jgi:hypothetical protein